MSIQQYKEITIVEYRVHFEPLDLLMSHIEQRFLQPTFIKFQWLESLLWIL